MTPESELYDPATDTIIPITGKLPFHGKVDNLAVRLYDDTVVIPTGGNANIQVLPDTSVYVPDQDDFIMAGSVQFPSTTGYGTGALLTDGRIVTGRRHRPDRCRLAQILPTMAKFTRPAMCPRHRV